jgi:hypothetical protein
VIDHGALIRGSERRLTAFRTNRTSSDVRNSVCGNATIRQCATGAKLHRLLSDEGVTAWGKRRLGRGIAAYAVNAVEATAPLIVSGTYAAARE